MLVILAGTFCFVAGLAGFTFVSAEGTSYLSDNPESCVNCHVMREQFEAWNHSSHHRVATCNDCHSAHESTLAKYVSKGRNGFNHSVAFTFNTFDPVITITEYNEDLVNKSCIDCHEGMVSAIAPDHDDAPNCISCHQGIGHPIRP